MRRLRWTVSLLLLLATSVASLEAQVSPGAGGEQAAPRLATVFGTVVADGTGAPLPYAAVMVDPIGRERFTDRTGSFTIYAMPPGKYRVRARQLGYMPQEMTIVIGDASRVSVALTMVRIPITLAEVQVSAPPRRCRVPDELGLVDDPELAEVLGEVRKNAERETLLRTMYPFEYRLAQAHDTYDLKGRIHSIRYDTAIFRSDDTWKYRKGRIVSDDRNRIFGAVRRMRLPTLADLADLRFLGAHCFKYSGIVEYNGAPTHRLDFAPDSTLRAPDVEGSIYIDSASYIIRTARFRLTRARSIKPAVLGMEVTTTYREILPNVALFDEIVSVQPLGIISPGGNPYEFREKQQLLNFRFLYGGPPGTDGYRWISVGLPGATTRGVEPLASIGPPQRATSPIQAQAGGTSQGSRSLAPPSGGK